MTTLSLVPPEIQHLDPDLDVKIEEEEQEKKAKPCTFGLSHPHDPKNAHDCGRPARWKIVFHRACPEAGENGCRSTSYFCALCWDHFGPSGKNQMRCSLHKHQFAPSECVVSLERIDL